MRYPDGGGLSARYYSRGFTLSCCPRWMSSRRTRTGVTKGDVLGIAAGVLGFSVTGGIDGPRAVLQPGRSPRALRYDALRGQRRASRSGTPVTRRGHVTQADRPRLGHDALGGDAPDTGHRRAKRSGHPTPTARLLDQHRLEPW